VGKGNETSLVGGEKGEKPIGFSSRLRRSAHKQRTKEGEGLSRRGGERRTRPGKRLVKGGRNFETVRFPCHKF